MATLTGRPLALAIVVATAACAHPVPRVSPPRPVPSPTRSSPTEGDTARSGPSPESATPANAPIAASRRDSAWLSPAEIAARATDLFGDAPADGDSASDATPSWDIDVRSYETRERVSRFVDRFSGSARETFVDWLERGSRYETFIRATLRERGIPEDMYYLALVESGFDPQAYSRSAAVGMWQFMASTAREAGLRVDWWIDERRDPIVSTDAAARFLAELHEQFGSLYLAAAAYNGGPGRVARGLTRFADDLEGTTGDDRFFALAEKDYLPSDTKNYVPQIIAAALIAKDPARYGVHARTLAPYAYDTARVAASTPLAAVARALHITVAQVMDLNPHVLRGVTPPEAPFLVRVPPGTGPSLGPALRALDDSDRTAFTHVRTHRNETLAAVAERAGVERRQLVSYNPSLRDVRAAARLKTGLVLLVPSEAVLSGARNVPDPSIEIYGRTRATAGAPTTHRVRRGETLGGLALRYHSSVKELSRLNHLKKPVIYAGQEIVVRGGTASTARHSGVAASPRSTAKTRATRPVKRSSKARASSKGKGASSKARASSKGKSTSSKARASSKGKGTSKASTASASRRKGSQAKAAKVRSHKKKAPKA